MNNELNIKSPVQIKDNSEARTAFDLMLFIANKEREANITIHDSTIRQYYLGLYKECLTTIKG